MEHSIQFNSDINAKIIAYLLKYSLNYSNETNLLSDSFTHDWEKNVFNLNLKLNHGNHTITYKDELIDIEYTNKNIILATADDIRKYETLVLSAKTQQTLLDFVEDARSSNANPEKNDKLICRILKPGGMWGILSKIAKRSDKTLFLDIDLDELFNHIQTFFDDEDDYIQHGVPFKMNFLFHGIPGTGKTSLIYTIASHFNLDISFLNITKDLDDNTFTRAITNLPENSILVLEDIDALFVDRDSKCNVSFSTVLNVLDGMIKKHKLLTFLTTNYKDRLDSALKRTGRVDYELEFVHATRKQTNDMYNYFFDSNSDEFMKFTKKLKYTTSDLHKFLFKNRKKTNIMEHIDEFIEILNKNIEKTPDHLYM
jgi:mitochondrial chaperone BCS1